MYDDDASQNGISRNGFYDWEDYDGNIVRRNSYYRPVYSKTFRCTSDNTCEDCTDNINCWRRMSWARQVDTNVAGAAWTRFTLLVHVSCDHPEIEIRYKVVNLKWGTLRTFWDSIEVTEDNFDIRGDPVAISPVTDTIGGDWWQSSRHQNIDTNIWVRIPDLQVGAHEVMMEWSPSRYDTTAWAKVEGLGLFMPVDYADCEDLHMCLEELSQHPDTTAADELRSSSQLQLLCLDAGPVADLPVGVCKSWRTCLGQSTSDFGHWEEKTNEEVMLMLLLAAGVHAAPSSSSSSLPANAALPYLPAAAAKASNQQKVEDSSQVDQCVNPLVEDAVGWACEECIKVAHDVCMEATSEASSYCLRAFMCMHDTVCTEWRDSFCEDAHIVELMGVLNDYYDNQLIQLTGVEDHREKFGNRMLIQRARVGDHKQTDLAFDDVLGHSFKYCR